MSSHSHLSLDSVTYHVKDSRQRSANIVEGYAKILQSQVIEYHHSNKYYR